MKQSSPKAGQAENMREKIEKLIYDYGEIPENGDLEQQWQDQWRVHDPVTVTLCAAKIADLFESLLAERDEEIERIFQEAWEDDPRSERGKQQEGTDAWMMGYRTAQKSLAMKILNSHRPVATDPKQAVGKEEEKL